MINLFESASTTNYRIYLVNQGVQAKNFWCFLQEPQGLPSTEVFGSSNAVINVLPNYGGTNYFTIPYQYALGCGASNEKVGLKAQVTANYIENIILKQVWELNYATVPPQQGPGMSLEQGSNSPQDTVGAKVNAFDQVKNENNSWYASTSFGIQGFNGYVGLVWSPSPADDYTITPKFAFYVTAGDYPSNILQDIQTIAADSVEIGLSDFKNLEVTVTLTSTGTWLVTPGKP